MACEEFGCCKALSDGGPIGDLARLVLEEGDEEDGGERGGEVGGCLE